jgi:ferredoxin-NADP reductase
MDLSAPAYRTTVLSRIWLNEETFELTCTRPQGLQFLAGQYVALLVQGEEREYTLLSPPDALSLRFLIKKVTGGQLSVALANIAPGGVLAMGKPKGYLTYRPTDRPVYFVATGVGIAPFVAMAADGVRGFHLLHGARTGAGLFYRQELAAAAGQYIPCLSGKDPSMAALPGLYHGYVTEYLQENLKGGPFDFYLCGSRAMIRDMTHFLDQHHPDTRIYSEAYS